MGSRLWRTCALLRCLRDHALKIGRILCALNDCEHVLSIDKLQKSNVNVMLDLLQLGRCEAGADVVHRDGCIDVLASRDVRLCLCIPSICAYRVCFPESEPVISGAGTAQRSGLSSFIAVTNSCAEIVARPFAERRGMAFGAGTPSCSDSLASGAMSARLSGQKRAHRRTDQVLWVGVDEAAEGHTRGRLADWLQ